MQNEISTLLIVISLCMVSPALVASDSHSSSRTYHQIALARISRGIDPEITHITHRDIAVIRHAASSDAPAFEAGSRSRYTGGVVSAGYI